MHGTRGIQEGGRITGSLYDNLRDLVDALVIIAGNMGEMQNVEIAGKLEREASRLKEIALSLGTSYFEIGYELYRIFSSMEGIIDDLNYPAFGIIYHHDEHARKDLLYLVERLKTLIGELRG